MLYTHKYLDVRMFFSLVSLLACRPDCPPNSSFDNGCLCEQDYYGDITWNKDNSSWNGECIDGLEKSMQTGDPSYIKNETMVLDAVSAEMQTTIERNSALISDIYNNSGVYYHPTEWSNHIRTADIDQNFVLVQGSDSGYALASAGSQGDSRYAAFGMNVVVSLDNGNQEDFAVPFSRLLGWLLTGSPSDDIESTYRIGVSSIGWDQDQSKTYFSSRFD